MSVDLFWCKCGHMKAAHQTNVGGPETPLVTLRWCNGDNGGCKCLAFEPDARVKVYIAAPYPLRSVAVGMMGILEAHGFVVTSRWLREKDDDGPVAAQKDLADIKEADALLALHPEGWHDRGTGGRHVELGYALALGKRIILLGQRTSNFHHLDAIEVTQTIEEAVEWLKR